MLTKEALGAADSPHAIAGLISDTTIHRLVNTRDEESRAKRKRRDHFHHSASLICTASKHVRCLIPENQQE
jgi:hypothetical protein